MSAFPSTPRLNAYERAMRRDRIFARLLDGQSAASIADEEKVTPRRIRQIIKESLERWDADPVQDYVGVQIARLESALRLIERKIAAGDSGAVDKLVRVLGQLDKYHRSQLRPVDIDLVDRDEAVLGRLERLGASRAAVAARLANAATAESVQAPEPASPPQAPAATPEEPMAALESAAAETPAAQELAAAPASGKENSPQVVEQLRPAEIPMIIVTRSFKRST